MIVMCRLAVGCGVLDGDGNGDSDGVCNRGGGLGFSWLVAMTTAIVMLSAMVAAV